MATNDGQTPIRIPPPPLDFQLNKLLIDIAEDMTDEELEKVKFLFHGDNGIRKKVSSEIKSPLDFFTQMQQQCFISRDNLIYLQCILHILNRQEFLLRAIKYAKERGNTFHFYSPSSEPLNGFKDVKVHVDDGNDMKSCSRKDIESLRSTVSTLLSIPPHLVVIRGIEPGSSLLITIMIPDNFAEILKNLATEKEWLAPLSLVGIDTISVCGKSFQVDETSEESTTETDQQMKLRTIYEQLEEKKREVDERDVEIIKLTRQLRVNQQPVFDMNVGLIVQWLHDEYKRQYESKRPSNLTTPSPLKKMCQLTRFKHCFEKVKALGYDLDIIYELLDANSSLTAGRNNETQELYISRLEWLLASLHSKVFQLQVEGEIRAIQKAYPLIENLLVLVAHLQIQIQNMSQQQMPHMGAAHEINSTISPYFIRVIQKASRGLRSKERKQLQKLYSLKEKEFWGLKMQDFLSFLYVNTLPEHSDIPIETFIIECLDAVGRQDLKERFMKDIRRISKLPATTFREEKQKSGRVSSEVEEEATHKIDRILEKVTNIETTLDPKNVALLPEWFNPSNGVKGFQGFSQRYCPTFEGSPADRLVN